MSKRTAKIWLAIALVALLATVQLLAHHAFSAEFDANRPVQLKGTVTKMEWINPHAWIHIDVTMEDGKVEQWMIEGGTPNTLFRRGFTKQSLMRAQSSWSMATKPRDGTQKANGRDLTFENGQRLFMGSSGTGAPRDGRDPTERQR